jgi:hypothetical protein
MLAGDASAAAIEGFIDKSLQPGPNIKKPVFPRRKNSLYHLVVYGLLHGFFI